MADSEAAKRRRKRAMVYEEILSTERTYVQDLEVLVKTYVAPLRDALKNLSYGEEQFPTLSASDINTLFGIVDAILKCNLSLLLKLEEDIENELDSVGAIFTKFAPYFKMYTTYVNNHDAALKKHKELLTKNTAYVAFNEKCRALPECRGQTLESYLIMPVQRIPRYRMLLDALKKKTAETHKDFHNIDIALTKVSDVAATINESLRDFENRNQVIRIQEKFHNGVQLVAAHRKFIREGALTKRCRRGPKSFHFVLFNDWLIYGSARTYYEAGTFKYHRTIDLVSTKVMPVGFTGEFQIKSPGKSFVVIAKSDEEKNRG